MTKHSNVMIFLLIFMMLVSACSGDKIATTDVPSGLTSTVDDMNAEPTIDICIPLDLPDVAFPRQEVVEGSREVMEAELVGDLVLNEGCLQIESLYGDSSYLPIWPPEFTARMDDGIPAILDGKGNVAGRVGEEIYMGGGETSGSTLPVCVQEQIPASCSGKYWIVGEGVRLNLQFDSDLFKMDLVPASDRTAILLKKEPILDEWAGEPERFTGFLRFYPPGRCPRIVSESGSRDFLPIWPPGYSLRIKENLVEIVDADGKVAARQDETVTLDGGLVPTNWENPNYRQLHYETPGDCFGPYWIVTP
jgi:hypothetical protein